MSSRLMAREIGVFVCAFDPLSAQAMPGRPSGADKKQQKARKRRGQRNGSRGLGARVRTVHLGGQKRHGVLILIAPCWDVVTIAEKGGL